MSLPKTMKAVVKYDMGPENVELREVPVPEIGPDEVLIQTKVAPVGSDVRVYKGDPVMCRALKPPVTLGSENAGVIAAVGKNVKAWQAGDRVISELGYSSCGQCHWCRTGESFRCTKIVVLGRGVDGAMADYFKANPAFLHRIPDGVSFEQAAMTEDLGVCISGFDQHGVWRLQDKIAILGPGPMGILSLMLAKKGGAGFTLVSGMGSDASRLSLCREFGADQTLNIEEEDLVQAGLDATGGEGFDVVVLATGAGPAVGQALQILKKYGTLMVIGFPGNDINVPWQLVAPKTPKILATWGASRWQDWEKSLDCISSGAIPAEKIITHSFPLEQWKEGFEAFDSTQACKVIYTV